METPFEAPPGAETSGTFGFTAAGDGPDVDAEAAASLALVAALPEGAAAPAAPAAPATLPPPPAEPAAAATLLSTEAAPPPPTLTPAVFTPGSPFTAGVPGAVPAGPVDGAATDPEDGAPPPAEGPAAAPEALAGILASFASCLTAPPWTLEPPLLPPTLPVEGPLPPVPDPTDADLAAALVVAVAVAPAAAADCPTAPLPIRPALLSLPAETSFPWAVLAYLWGGGYSKHA